MKLPAAPQWDVWVAEVPGEVAEAVLDPEAVGVLAPEVAEADAPRGCLAQLAGGVAVLDLGVEDLPWEAPWAVAIAAAAVREADQAVDPATVLAVVGPRWVGHPM